ncbi:LpqB family beta-propeller domain-containing protein [Streptomyces sp. NPDC089799]|uniref:LpqB family beta-propeller domain-containing protein n=1 Tax=Streptomyces sp. NPDC089799 TaxID=3155066 RepID=UPI0034414072
MNAKAARGAEPRGGRVLRARGVLALGGVGLLLAGCASMPDHGEVKQVSASQGADSEVRVYGVPPAPKAGPREIVDGFLEAMTSDDPQLATARQYLSKEAAQTWKPNASITVLASGRDVSSDKQGKDPDAPPGFKLYGTRVATVDERSTYHPEVGRKPYERHLQLVKEDNEWRIDSPPDGLVLSESDFQRIFMPVNKYYFASDTLVADPVYVRQRTDPDSRMDRMTQTVKSLLDGPSKWLGPVVTSTFPSGTTLLDGTKTLSYDAQDTLRVPLNDKADNVAGPQCERMATQLMYTVRDLASSRVARVELVRPDKKSVICGVTEAVATGIAGRVASPTHQYFIDGGRLTKITLPSDPEGTPGAATPVGGPLATAQQLKLASAAVAYEEKRAAVVGQEGHHLYVVSLTQAGPLPDPVIDSRVKDGLSAPSWDGRGDVWVADRDPQNPVLWRIPAGTGTPQKVDVVGLDGRIEALKASSDGVRMALLVSRVGKDGAKKNELLIGRVERPEGSGTAGPVSVRELRPAAPQMADVTAMSWAPRGRLLVVGRESGGVSQARYMQADGSMAAGSLPGATGVTAVAASEDEKKPVVAYSEDDGIVWLPPGSQWRTVAAGGRAPVYPG